MSKGRLPRYCHIVCKHHWPRNLPDHPCSCLFCHVCRRLMWRSCWTNTLFLPVHQKLGNLYLLPARNTASQSVLFQEAFPSGRGLLSCQDNNQHARKVLQIKIPNMQLLVQIYKICLVVLLPIRYSFLYFYIFNYFHSLRSSLFRVKNSFNTIILKKYKQLKSCILVLKPSCACK